MHAEKPHIHEVVAVAVVVVVSVVVDTKSLLHRVAAAA